MSTWQTVISMSSEFFLLINVVFFFLYLWRHSDIYKYFSGLLVFSLLIEIITHVMWYQHKENKQINNLYLLHLYTVVEFIFITLFYNQIFKGYPFWRKYIYWFIFIVLGLIVSNSMFLQKLTQYNSYAKTLTQLIYIAYATGYFLTASHNKMDSTFKRITIINSAILLYYSGSLFIFMFSNVFFDLDEVHLIFWVFNALLYLIFQLLVFYAIWKGFRQTKSTYS